MDHDGRIEKKMRNRGKQRATSNTVTTDRSHLCDYWQEPATGRDDESGQEDALDWLDKNYTADLKSYDQATRWESRSKHAS